MGEDNQDRGSGTISEEKPGPAKSHENQQSRVPVPVASEPVDGSSKSSRPSDSAHAPSQPYHTSVPIDGVNTFASAADARSAILEYATRTAKGLTTNEDTLRALDNWVAEFNRVNRF